ncbi:MAG: class I SAM-dependent methyltransferase [Saprospiraceae bacterium]|nr:class I SAM-dependent methyltransferase [Saprospiraceae bacterium]MCB0542664.1 class I SAM-dependent methyltransferase [Saprospiraceae bacterium]MCB0575437.1 class I SAM-dependent methyltransferase [Saprospiraceae bacterium]MCB9352996.1 class I SAM-dependent methyltransferase [Lewinellaceae bacterium]
MLAKIFLELTEFSWFRRIAWKPIYNHLAKQFPYDDWVFMNYGYEPADPAERPELDASDEPDRYPLQLYHFLATRTEIKDKTMLEVGSGRGGGASYIARYLKPEQITGMDIANHAVEFAGKRHQSPNLRYVTGNAEAIPFGDESFDVVINVESSHAYGSVERFFSEVRRVLRPGGYFLITDMRDPKNLASFEETLLASGLQMASKEVISERVVQAIELEDDLKRARIRKQIPARYVKFFEEFGGVKGSQIDKDLRSGSLVYFWYVMRKV